MFEIRKERAKALGGRRRLVREREQGGMVRRYIIRRNKHAADKRLREVVSRANAA